MNRDLSIKLEPIGNFTDRMAALSPAKRALLDLKLKKKAPDASGKQTIPRRANRDLAPLSFAQQRLWFLDQLEPNSCAYNQPKAIRISGALNVEALQKALNIIVARHEVLRTTFASANGSPVQVIGKSRSFDLSVIDLCNWPDEEREAEVQRLMVEKTQLLFNLSRDLMLRATLLRLGKEEHVLLLVTHHIASDGWSGRVLSREIAMLYKAFSTGSPSPLPELPIQYADFAVWQRESLQGEVLKSHLSYWKRQLAGSPPVLELPIDRPRPAVQTFRGAKQSLVLPTRLNEALKELSQQQGVTLFMTLLAAFQTLLHRYTSQDDIVVGSPIAGRNRVETEGLIGFFVNTLVLRLDLSGNPSFLELLGRVREVALGAYAHQDFPFEKLVEELHPERSMSRTPLFQVWFALQNVPMLTLDLPGLTLSPLRVNDETAKFDLSLYMMDKEQELIGTLEYNTDLFEPATIARMLGHFQTLLEGIVANPEQRLSDLPILTDRERQQLLVEWNDTASEYLQDKCIHQLFEAQVERTPDTIAVIFGDEQLTYRELNARANRLAHYLKKRGVGPEVLAGICIDCSLEMVVGLLGILKAGGAYVPLDPSYPPERLAFMLEDARVAVLLTLQRLQNSFQLSALSPQPSHSPTPKVVCLDTGWETIARESDKNQVTVTTAENSAYVIYTSGSTGKPKGVQIPHRAVVNFLHTMGQQPGLTNRDTLLAVTTLSFDIAVLEIFLPMTVGARLVLTSREVATDGALLSERLANSCVTTMQATPATWQILLEAGWQGRNQLKILCGGEALPRELANQLLERGASLWNLYGPTETTIWSAVYQVDLRDGPTLIGRPIANTQIYILDSYLKPVPIGVAGELHIGGAGLARGYLDRPELTTEKFIPNPFSPVLSEVEGDEPGARLYKTGDLARYLPDGNIEFLGRLDHQVKIRGFRIELGEIETVLGQYPAVRENVIIAREDSPGEKHLVAYVVPCQEPAPIINELRIYLKEKLPDYMVPSAFVMLEALPLTPSGKVDRKALPVPDHTRPELEKSFIAPKDTLELHLTKIWEEVLDIKPIGVQDNFFALGGHSLLAVRLFARMEKKFGNHLSLASIFQAPTIKQQASILCQKPKNYAFQPITEKNRPTVASPTRYFNRTIWWYLIDKYASSKQRLFLKTLYYKIIKSPLCLYLKKCRFKIKTILIKRYFSYTSSQLEHKLRTMGLTSGDTVLMHSSFKVYNGFQGGPQQVIDCILKVIGPSGNLLMVSMPYGGSSFEYLKDRPIFDVRRSPSSMGIITEVFRTNTNVLRSLSPSHPILALGPKAKWMIADHEKTMYPCGSGSPFEKILKLNAKALLFDMPSNGISTFFHYLEDTLKEHLPVKLYDEEPLEATVIDSNGNRIKVKSYVFSSEARRTRNSGLLKEELRRNNVMRSGKIGNTKLILADLNSVVDCARKIVISGKPLYQAKLS